MQLVENYLYMRNVFVKAPVIARITNPNITLSGNATQWERVREYVYTPSAPIVKDGVSTGANSVSNLGLEQAPAGPPAGLPMIHGWDAASFPTWHSSAPLDIRNFGAVQSDTDDAAGLDNSTAINNALAAGIAQGKAVFVPRGFFYVRAPVTIPAGTILLGSSFTNCVINSSRHWQPGALTDLVNTANAVGDITISDVCINGHEGSATQGIASHRFITIFHCRTSNMLTRCLHINRREWFSGGASQFHAPAVKFTGNAGGRIYNLGLDLFHGSTASMHADHRMILIDGTSQPLAIYQPDMEGTENSPQGEIKNSSNVTWYGLKHEPGIEFLDIRDSGQHRDPGRLGQLYPEHGGHVRSHNHNRCCCDRHREAGRRYGGSIPSRGRYDQNLRDF